LTIGTLITAGSAAIKLVAVAGNSFSSNNFFYKCRPRKKRSIHKSIGGFEKVVLRFLFVSKLVPYFLDEPLDMIFVLQHVPENLFLNILL
jgi:hypothetical protein